MKGAWGGLLALSLSSFSQVAPQSNLHVSVPGTSFSAANWSGYDEATATNPGSGLSGFSLLIDIATLSASWKSAVQSDGGDIRLTKGDGTTELAYDLINWAYNAGSPTGQIRVLWSGTLAASGTQNVRIYAGYTPGTAVAYDANETYGSDNAYDSTVEQYWTFSEASGDIISRVAGGTDLTVSGATYGATGVVGDALSFDGVNDVAYTSSALDLTGTQELSVLMNTYQDTITSDDDLLLESSANYNSNDDSVLVNPSSSGGGGAASGKFHIAINAEANGRNSIDMTRFSAATWTHLGIILDRDAGAQQVTHVYYDGVSQTLQQIATTTDSTTGFGNYVWNFMCRSGASSPGLHADGDIQHVFFYNVALGADWVAQESDMMDQATFWGTWAWTAGGGGGGPTILRALSSIESPHGPVVGQSLIAH